MKREFWDEYWEDNDNQDGSYFNEKEKKSYDEDDRYDSSPYEFEEKKYRALLYIRLHSDLLENEHYRTAFYSIIDFTSRLETYALEGRGLTQAEIQEQRKIALSALDIEIGVVGKQRVEKYKNDAQEIASMVAEGKSIPSAFG